MTGPQRRAAWRGFGARSRCGRGWTGTKGLRPGMDGNIEAPIVAAAPTHEHEHAQEHAGAPISRIVAEVAARFPGGGITLGDMALAFGDRAFGLLILLLLLPSLLPGMASVFGTPVLILGVQMGLGRS